ncbi:MAG: DHH family phosphoesterase [Candidatus Poseidoniaceae archaeon]|tara:strand:- start:180 stop:1538 length:1359 start_codon:yes stop_codon:yes gene_type:complete
MFLIFGSDSLAIRLAEWIGARSRVRIIGLADQIVGMEDAEIVALPTEMELHEMPLPDVTPTAILLLEEIICDDDPVQELRNHWPNTPILSTIDIDGAERISVEDLTISAIQDRLRSIDRKQGASEVLRRLNEEENAKVLIVCHDNPDPDALASALAIKHLCESIGHEPTIVHGGMIEHQQNRAMVKLLEMDVRRIILDWEIEDILTDSDLVICVDFSHPGANNILPPTCVPHIVIDHHTSDTRPAGDVILVRSEFAATSSLVASILMNSGIEINRNVATALAFGIRTDTLGFTRSFNAVDLRALSWLGAWIDWELMRSFESPPRSQEVLSIFKQALTDATLENGLMLAPVTQMTDRDALSQVADFLLPTEDVDVVITYGVRISKVILSARSTNDSIHIGRILSNTFEKGRAGGHKSLAGGQIPFEEIGCENGNDAIKKMSSILKNAFGGEME